MALSYWICAIVTVISAAVSLGYSVAGLRASSGEARTPSLYAFARSLALLVVAVVALVTGLVPVMAVVAVAMIIVQAVDAVIGVTIRDRLKIIGPAATSAANAAALVWMLLS